MKKYIGFTAAIFFTFFSLTSCNSLSTPEKTIQKFENSIQNMDIDGIFECYEPEMAKGMKATVNIVGDILGVNINDIIDILPFAITILGGDNSDGYGSEIDMYKAISINVVGDVKYSTNNSEATVEIEIKLGEESENKTIDMIKIDGKWYIVFDYSLF